MWDLSMELKQRIEQVLENEPLRASKIFNYTWFETPIGEMLIVAENNSLILVDFVDRKLLERRLIRLKLTTNSKIILGTTPAITSVKKELTLYFEKKVCEFKTPVCFFGTIFQEKVWQSLRTIPFGKTVSYSDQASLMGAPKAYRAIANANGANHFAIIIPCHRVINHNGNLGGYGGGLSRKKWLLVHESSPSILA